MILTGDKVSVGTNRSNIIDFLIKPKNLEHLLPMDKVKDFKLGQIIEQDCRLESHRNKKNRDLWYHKLLLQ